MMDRIMAVVTREQKYAERFCDYVNRTDRLSLLAVPFCDMESCLEYSKKHGIELLISDAALSERVYGGSVCTADDIDAQRRIYLADSQNSCRGVSDESFADFSGGSIVLNKYQSAESLMAQVVESTGGERILKKRLIDGSRTTAIGVYSPDVCSGKTLFAFTVCRDLSRKNRVLYMNLEEFPPVLRLFGTDRSSSGGLSDAIYKLKQGRLDEDVLRQLINTNLGIDWIAPVSAPEDFLSISGEDYATLIEEIIKRTAYDYLIIDMNRFSGQADVLTELCSTVYMPCGCDVLSKMKRDEFTYYAESEKSEKWRKKLRWVEIPEQKLQLTGTSYLDELLYGEMGDIVRDINRE